MANEVKSEEVIVNELTQLVEKVKLGGKYAHYKHPSEPRYEVLGVGVWEKTEEMCVMYKRISTGIVWVRTAENFLDEVEYEGKKVKRFKLVEERQP